MNRQRRSIRLKGYDYSQSSWHFITVCTQNSECLFGDIVGATRGSPTCMELNGMGKIIENVRESLPKHHSVILDEFQTMPNHVHLIIHIIDTGGPRPAPTLGTIIGLFKSECTKQINIVGADPRVRPISMWYRDPNNSN